MTTLHTLFVRAHARFMRSPHVEDLADFARWMLERLYATAYVKILVCVTKRALDGSNLPPGNTWTSDRLNQAFRPYWHSCRYRGARHTFGVYLQSIGRLVPPPSAPGIHAATLTAYRDYLANVRGLAPATIRIHLAEVHALVRHALPTGKPWKHLSAPIIEQYIKERARGVTRCSLRKGINYLRAFLRYCHDRNLIETRLDQLDLPVCFRDERLPRALDWKLIQKLLRSIDRTDPSGWRDFMILHLMAHYGLRPGEVIRLTVDSIHWEHRTLLIEQSKIRSWLTLPLLDETLNLLRRYLKEGRRETQRAELFLSTRTLVGHMNTNTVCKMFKDRVRKAGLPMAHASPYALRHSFAMRLFARGVGIKAIGDIMGHSSLDSTAVYLRLQTKMLREVALPVPRAISGGAA